MSRPLLVCILILIAACTGSSQNTDPAKRIYKDAAQSVFLVYLNDTSGTPTALGTAFVIGPRTLITNAHVVESGSPVLAVGPVRIPVTVVRRDDKNDLALLRVDVDLTSPPLPLSDALPSPGERVYAIGNPEGLEKSISEGLISAIRDEDGRKLLQISSPISHGSSGGPILDSDGKVVGVAVGMIPEGENLNFAVPAEFVRDLEMAGTLSKGVEVAGVPTISDIEALLTAKNNDTYSADQSSPYQIASAKLDSAIHLAVPSTRNVDDLRQLACLGIRSWDAVDDGIAAARTAYKSSANVANSGLLAYSLYQGASLQDIVAAFAKDGSDEKHKAQETGSNLLAEAALIAGRTKASNGKLDDVAIFILGAVADEHGDPTVASGYFEKIAGHSVQECGNDLRMIAMRDLISEENSLKRPGDAETWFRKFALIYSPSAFDWDSEGNRRDAVQDYTSAADANERAAAAADSLSIDYCWASQERFLSGPAEADATLADGRKCIDASVKNTSDSRAKQFAERAPTVYRIMATVLEDRGVHDAALSDIKESLAAAPNDPNSLYEESQIFESLNQYSECVSSAKAAIAASDGKFRWMQFELGSCYFDMQDWVQAEASFKISADADKTDAASAFNLGLSLLRQGFGSDAKVWFNESLRRNPSAELREKIMDALRGL